ncbi:MAG: response regulator, partial [Gemmatimonadetes bacterium]|nr:response regulator [Gemmatimonadota bacterium]
MKHKVLIVDDDLFSRKILRKLLRAFPCTILEAADGLQALQVIATEAPDLVFLDVNMPVLDGLQTLQEIRSSPVHARLPVVSVSANTERDLVMELIQLGLAGFLVKPLRPGETYRRLDVLFQRLKNTAPSGSAMHGPDGQARKQRLLLIDSDPNFREFARSLLDCHFEVLEASTGAVGLQLFNDFEPGLVCVSERLELLGAQRLLQMIRGVRSSFAPRIFLLSESGEAPAIQQPLLDGVIRRSFIPDAFDRELRRTLLVGESAAATIVALLRGSLRAELITATQQSIGVMTSQDVAVREGEAAPPPAGRVLRTRTELTLPDGSVTVGVGLLVGEDDALRIGRKILGEDAPLDQGAGGAVAELVSAIAGRVCASF